MKILKKINLSRSNYGYLNARLRARWCAFFAMDFFESMAGENLDLLEQALLSGPYASRYRKELAITNASVLERIERAIALGASDRLRAMKSMASEEASILIPVLLIKSDIFNSRVLIRKYHRKTPSVMPPHWHDYGSLEGGFFESIWRDCDHPVEAIERCYSLGDPVAIPLAEALEHLMVSGDIVEAERTYMAEIVRWSRRRIGKETPGETLISEYLDRVVDLWNMQIWFRKNLSAVEEAKSWGFLENGGLGISKLESSQTLEELLKDSPWSYSKSEKGETPGELGRFLQTEFFRWQISHLRRDSLGIGVSIAYTARQSIEWRNMEILAVGLAARLPADRIKGLLWRI